MLFHLLIVLISNINAHHNTLFSTDWHSLPEINTFPIMPSLCHPVIAVCEFTSRRASTVQDVNISGVFVALIHSFAPPELSSSFESCECFGNRLGQGLLVLAVLV